MYKVKLIETEDGSHSLYVPELNETYHSFHGACHESRHVFINQGLRYWCRQYPGKPVAILEVGFGTGLNVLLTAMEMAHIKQPVSMTTLEPNPLPAEIIAQLNYGKLTGNQTGLFQGIHTAPWEQPVPVVAGFTLTKLSQKLEDFTGEASFDVIYFDAFAPGKQPGLWTFDVLQKVYNRLHTNGILITYCAKGQFKRDLKAIGFEVDTLQGPPGKKEMVRATRRK